MSEPKKNPHAVALGRQGGLKKSAKKAVSSRRNGLVGAIRKKILAELKIPLDTDKRSA